MSRELRGAAIRIFGDAGWQYDLERGPALEKVVPSAVGAKKAHIWLWRTPDQVGNVTVKAEFWSEGRNILEASCLLVNIDSSVEAFQEKAASFLQKINDQISNSFAVRLMRA